LYATFIPHARKAIAVLYRNTGKGWRLKSAPPDYEAQVLQSPEVQLEQELPVPAIVWEIPPSVLLKQAKVDILRRAGL
jgi:hypothetical protein